MNKYEVIGKSILIAGGATGGSYMYNNGDSFTVLESYTKQNDTIGTKYKDFLIMEEQKDEWIAKQQKWIQQLSSSSNPFKWNKNNQQPKWSDVRQRCKKEYKKNNWDDLNKKKNKKQYWDTVWTYCGKTSQSIPEGWGK